jgi:hypothetical protein
MDIPSSIRAYKGCDGRNEILPPTVSMRARSTYHWLLIDKTHKYSFLGIMKTTLEVPDELYREVKSRAALRHRKIKDYVAEGLRLALEADDSRDTRAIGPLSVFDEVRAQPLHKSKEVKAWMDRVHSERKSDWRDES